MDTLRSRGPAEVRELEALLVLQDLPGVGLRRVHALLRGYGVPSRVLADLPRLRRVVGDAAVSAARDSRVWDRAREALGRAGDAGMEVLSVLDGEYPDILRQLADPPPVLFLRGRTDLLVQPGVGVVGARRCTHRARDVARRLGATVARTGTPVVSGLALGVDGQAHRGALDVSGPTVAVLGCGADVAYPRSHHRLFQEVLRSGLVVSEFLPGTRAAPHHFPRRNRILAALSRVLVVVEAGARSGALISVDHALDLGVDVWAVPGPIEEPACAGSNRLLAEGARALVSVRDFAVQALGVQASSEASTAEGEGTRPGGVRGRAGGAAPPPGPSDTVLQALVQGSASADEVVRRTGLPAARVLTALAGLELEGRVTRLPGMRFRKAG